MKKEERWDRVRLPWVGDPARIPYGAPLWYWMSERQAIWERRNNGQPKPWTADPILQRYRFCNVFRELDTVTEWIREHIRIPFADDEHLWFMLAIARYINHPETLLELINTPGAWPRSDVRAVFHPERMTAVLDHRKSLGLQVYTGAYMIRAESDPKAPWFKWTKQRYIAEVVLGRLWADRRKLTEELEAATKLEETWALLAKEPHYVGWGPFMAYEWVTDLRWTRYLDDPEDKMTWANAGPGALRGLRRLLTTDGKLHPTDKPKDPVTAMRVLLEQAPTQLPPGFDELEMRDIEHSLCETDKYLRVFHGEGKPRSSYDGLP